ncbi:hypothetical protein O1L44_00050 [Streptomyces noursei]|uniref:hypothetical protein n=1 Tax=Streptomyces noursei TaxID=1971 RepID=UPI00081C9F72|nr:hypothetical protein SNOUR_01135 [Streptomyces noursei ATCC 11455]MCZ0991851.1 hypothetical protein [Streptomyces noursei]
MSDPNLPFSSTGDAPFPGPGSMGTIADGVFGNISVDLDTEHGTLVVEGERIPRVELSRLPGGTNNECVPIGTRDGSGLSMTVAGTQVRVSPTRGHLTRRSYRVDTTYGGTTYRLVPCGDADSKLLKNRRHIGVFTSRGDGSVEAKWQPSMKVQPPDAAVGYTLAAAFGTGARSSFELILDVLDAFTPAK